MTFERTEAIILRELMTNQVFVDRCLPDLDASFFLDHDERILFEAIQAHIVKFNQLPTEQTVTVALDDRPGDFDHDPVLEYLRRLVLPYTRDSLEWLMFQTGQFIRDKGVHVGVLSAIAVLDKQEKKKTLDECLDQIREAHDFKWNGSGDLNLDDWEPLFTFLQSPDEKFPFAINKLNEMTCGGPSRKTVTVVVAPTNTGKSLVLCHHAAEYLRQHRNVVYITLEMADKKILKRIYANLLDTELNTLDRWSRDQWSDASDTLTNLGKLKVKEYPSRSAHAGNFRTYLKELRTREKFIPDVVIIDYLNECTSRTMRYGKNIGMYQYVGSICSELRALATEFDAVLWTATQTNRDGYDGDPDLKNTSESAQTNHTGDLILGVQKDQMEDQLRFKVMKTRDQQHKDAVFIVGVNRAKMRLFDIENPAIEAAAINAKRKQLSKNRTTKLFMED